MLVPDALANLASLSWRLLAVTGLVAALWYLATLLWTVTASIAVAVVVSALLAPLVVRLRARGRSRTSAAAIVWTAGTVCIGAVLLLLAVAFMPYIASLVTTLQAAIASLEAALAQLQLPGWFGTALHALLGALRSAAEGSAGGIVSKAAEVVTVMVLATFLVFFFLRDGDRAWLWAFQAFSDQKRERITHAGENALARVGGYLRGTTVLSALIALTDLLFMLALGVPLAGPLAVLVFLSGYIPYFGGIVTTFLILIVTYGSLGASAAIAMIVLIAVRNVILGYGVRPAVYGRTVSIHPALVLLVLPAGFQLAGIIGLFAAVPVTAIVAAVTSATIEVVTPSPSPELPGLVPSWLDRMAQWSWRLLLGIALVALLLAIVTAVPLVLVPMVVATILAATVGPIVDWLVGRGRSRGQAAAMAVGGGCLAIMLLVVAALAVMVEQMAPTMSAAAAGASSVDSASGDQLGILAQAVKTLGVSGVQTVFSIADQVATLAVIGILSTLLTFYLIRDGGRLWRRVLDHTPPEVAPQVHAAGARAYEVLGGYMFGTAVVSFVGAASQAVIMIILGIPYVLPVFVLSFVLCFIPYIGGFISTGIALLLTIAFGSQADIVIMVIWTLVFNIVTGNIVSPLVYGRTVHLHPAVVLVAIPAGAAIAGMLGMFIVVPVLGVVAATWRTVFALMGDRADRGAPDRSGSPPDAAHEPLPDAPEPPRDAPEPPRDAGPGSQESATPPA